jgi:hypothetical protein
MSCKYSITVCFRTCTPSHLHNYNLIDDLDLLTKDLRHYVTPYQLTNSAKISDFSLRWQINTESYNEHINLRLLFSTNQRTANLY